MHESDENPRIMAHELIENPMETNNSSIRRIRLSEWAKRQGISRITAYRMLRRGLLPVPCERSPTGRWYVLIQNERHGHTAVYARATPDFNQVEIINRQVSDLTEWAAERSIKIFTVVREIAEPFVGPMPRLGKLLADNQVTDILIAHPLVLGRGQFHLINSALSSQGRTITSIHNELRGWDGRAELHAGLTKLCILLHGNDNGTKWAKRVIDGS